MTLRARGGGDGGESGIWTLDFPFTMPGGVEIGTRTTVVRLPDRSLAVHSPGEFSSGQVDAIGALGPVSTLIAPNGFHHLFVEKAVELFPNATVHAARSVIGKYPQLGAEPLGAEPAAAWRGALEQTYVAGAPRLDETVFFHPASRTLLLVDLCFNIQRADRLRTKFMMTLTGAWKNFGPSRIARSLFKDKAAVRASVDRILEWDFDRVIVTHGECLETGGRERLRESFAWLK